MITRRHFFKVSAKALAAWLVAQQLGCAAEKSMDSETGFPSESSNSGSEAELPLRSLEELIAALAELAELQFSDSWDQEAYVEDVKLLIESLDLNDPDFTELYAGYVNTLGTFPELTTIEDGGYFEVATVEFEAGDEIPLHNHPDMTGVIFCVAGSVMIEQFDLISDEGDRVLLQLRTSEVCQAGDFSTLTAERGNIHALYADEYTALFDIFTPPYDDERLQKYRWYERAATPLEEDGDIYEAWET